MTLTRMPKGSQLRGQGPGAPDDSCLGGGVHRGARATLDPVNGGDVDDRATAASLHQGYGQLAAEVHAAQVGVHQAVVVLVLHLLDRIADADTGVVEEDVEAAEALLHGGEQALHLLTHPDIGWNGQNLAARLFDFRFHPFQLFRGARRDGDLGPVLGEQQGDAAADALAAPGYDGDPVLESHVLLSLASEVIRRSVRQVLIHRPGPELHHGPGKVAVTPGRTSQLPGRKPGAIVGRFANGQNGDSRYMRLHPLNPPQSNPDLSSSIRMCLLSPHRRHGRS